MIVNSHSSNTNQNPEKPFPVFFSVELRSQNLCTSVKMKRTDILSDASSVSIRCVYIFAGFIIAETTRGGAYQIKNLKLLNAEISLGHIADSGQHRGSILSISTSCLLSFYHTRLNQCA